MNSFLKFVILIFVFLLCLSCLSSTLINPPILLLKDSSGQLEIEPILHKLDDFAPVKQLNLGYENSPCWIALDVPCNKECFKADPLYVSLSHPSINYVDFFWVRGDSILKEIHTGSMRPVMSREFPFTHFSFLIPTPQKKDQIFIRIQNIEGSLKTKVAFYGDASFFKNTQVNNLVFLFFLGIGVFQLIYASLQAFLRKDPLLYWYIIFIFFVIIHQSFNFGYFQFLLPDFLLSYTNTLRFIGSPLAIIGLLGFAYHLLDIRVLLPRLVNKLFLLSGLIYIVFFALLLVPLEVPVRFFLLHLFNICLFSTLLLLLYSSLRALYKGHKPAYYFLLSQLPVLAVLFIYILRNHGYIPHVRIFNYLGIIAASIEITCSLIILTIYLNRISIGRKKLHSSILSSSKPQSINGSERLIFDRLTHYFEQEKPYLNPSLKIKEVANKLEISVHELSRIINQQGSMHFFDFVNSYRVKHSTNLLALPEHSNTYTLETIAFESGFNNRTSFNNAFKKFTSTTPSTFRKQSLKNN